MSARRLAVITFLRSGILAFPLAAPSFADDREVDELASKQQTTAFVEAVNSGTAETVAGFWTEGGEYSGGDGMTVRGRDELEDAYRTHFKEAGIPKVSHEIDTIRFLSRDTAVAEGSFESTSAE